MTDLPELPTDVLTERQAAFVFAYIANGGDHEAAALDAGYASANEGYRLLKHPNVIKALQPGIVNRLSTGAVKALAVIERLMSSARSDYVKLEAARDWLDRAGYKPPERTMHRISADLSVSFDVAPPAESGLVISGKPDQTTPGVEKQEE